jgi:cysteine-rich repeat protein
VIETRVRVGGRLGPRQWSRRLRLTALAVGIGALCNALSPRPLAAHGVPTPLDFWGAFGRRVARCQRIIGRSAAVCGLRAWNIRQACALGALHGMPCDESAADSAVETARVAAVDAVDAACTEDQVAILVFLGKYEAESDVVTFCRELEAAAVSAVFRPVPADPSAASPAVARCVSAAALVTTKLLHGAFDSRQILLDRFALDSFSPATKKSMVAASTAAIAGAEGALMGDMTSACPAADFVATYGTNPASFFGLIASRADCLAGQTYAQGGILCPPAVCGNGMKERGEDCDDGNLIDGDGCSSTCMLE